MKLGFICLNVPGRLEAYATLKALFCSAGRLGHIAWFYPKFRILAPFSSSSSSFVLD